MEWKASNVIWCCAHMIKEKLCYGLWKTIVTRRPTLLSNNGARPMPDGDSLAPTPVQVEAITVGQSEWLSKSTNSASTSSYNIVLGVLVFWARYDCISMMQRRHRPSEPSRKLDELVVRNCERKAAGVRQSVTSTHNSHVSIRMDNLSFMITPHQPLRDDLLGWHLLCIIENTDIISVHILNPSSPWSHLPHQPRHKVHLIHSSLLIQWRWFPWWTSSGIMIVMCHTN